MDVERVKFILALVLTDSYELPCRLHTSAPQELYMSISCDLHVIEACHVW